MTIKEHFEQWAAKYATAPHDWNTVPFDENYYMVLTKYEQINRDPRTKEMLESKQLGLASMLYLRVKYMHSYTIQPAAALMIGSQLRNPGEVTMTANYLEYMSVRDGFSEVTKHRLVACYTMGLLSEDDSLKMWGAQKGYRLGLEKVDNLLDEVSFK